MNEIFFFFFILLNLTHVDLQWIQTNLILIWNYDMKLRHDNWEESENKSAELMFPNWFWTPKLKVLHFSIHENYLHSYVVHVTLFFGLSPSLIPHFWKIENDLNLKLNTKFRSKETYEKGVDAPYDNKFGGFSVSYIKWRGIYRQNCST